MRQNNQNKQRMRGRGRKGPNPLTRTYDSNGPDVKVRGTAHHIAEKYQQLARDAQASGDRVMAENYLQHAEHYLRIIAAAQPSQSQPQRHQNDEPEKETTDSGNTEAPISVPVMAADAPQPVVDGIPDFNTKHGGTNGKASQLGDRSEGATENGAVPDASGGQEAGEAGDDAKPRRRTRGARGRGVRRPSAARTANSPAAAPEPDGSEAPVVSSEPVAEAVASESEAPAPKRRRRTTKTATEAKPVEEAESVQGEA